MIGVGVRYLLYFDFPSSWHLFIVWNAASFDTPRSITREHGLRSSLYVCVCSTRKGGGWFIHGILRFSCPASLRFFRSLAPEMVDQILYWFIDFCVLLVGFKTGGYCCRSCGGEKSGIHQTGPGAAGAGPRGAAGENAQTRAAGRGMGGRRGEGEK